ncbi:uncharacterized protein BCR38DRAFT_482366 [Pseudomassariella vexata]|uniref:Yeast cell wall synthesis Kre9/Knh1-like N-terminal domain-containing protein n=1 Tax=Pseudomassariella vexata TaxID=1141098 RepID=A0A1Y2EBE0_9PEZI|nr:uncharacterized protein BCR38DRAFT_482366 [Pseudomassariella vexata]ORY68893.1 hypothetical protein BCR38DRAFT_482366 [Pseudomassariella vexata]
MRVLAIASSILYIATSALAAQPTSDFCAFETPIENEELVAGTDFLIKWTNSGKYTGKVKIDLMAGKDANSLTEAGLVNSNYDVDALSLTWPVWTSLGTEPMYGFLCTLEENEDIFQWSKPFTIKKSS